ncbi:helix-turn-helix transcriptional regulator [Flavivirga amylovorans]|uniref:Helix-turn-helix transcriptional regulator n=1 Tax=Flavivirga amylovorans TaxID=870486 RepID=A0ABT8WWT9_9FLAO|nr:response regulator transcription factor [Flavivirga amylovorans]MDO5986149.1 helix-turn-helix transcriptional regulator [Flavivirga amylovorans]
MNNKLNTSALKYTVLPLKQQCLEPFVKRISYIENETIKPQSHLLPPLDTIGFTFFFGDQMRTEHKQETVLLHKRACIAGIITKEDVSIVHQGVVKQIFVKFTPTGFYRLFKKEGKEFTNKPPADLSTINAQALEMELENCPKEIENIQEVIENYLLSKIPTALPEIPLINMVIELMQEDITGRRNVEDICEKVGVNQRYLFRLFKKVIGISPKKYYKTLQWNTIMTIINENEEESLTRIALECGFYDHPSFTKEFKKFMGISPSKFINNDIQLAELALKRNS